MFGPTEVAAALPTLLSSLLGIAAIAWYVGWPRDMTWRSTSAVLLAITLPLDIGFRSVPGAIYMASSFLICGSVLILKGGPWLRAVGCACFAFGFLTHEVSCFYIAIFSITAVLIDRERYLRPLILSATLSVIAVAVQCGYYGVRFSDPFLRFRLSASDKVLSDTDPSGIGFLLWPFQSLVFSKVFACDLMLVFCLGAVIWKKLRNEERILLVSGFLTWFYFGYGSAVPWDYRPFAREFHYYGTMNLAISALLPVCIGHLFEKSARARIYTLAMVGTLVALNLACSAGGGRWGQDVKVSASLLGYALRHPDERFLTDVPTMNQMYVVNRFRLPPNVFCRNGPAVQHDLLLNKEPSNMPRFAFPEVKPDGILLNLDHRDSGFGGDKDFVVYLAAHSAPGERIAPLRYKLLFFPIRHFVAGKFFAIRTDGGSVIGLN